MAIIDIKFSQAVIDLQNTPSFDKGAVGSLSDAVDVLVSTNYLINVSHQEYGSVNWSGSALTLNHKDGATATYTGVVRDDVLASAGTASATGYAFYLAGALSIAQQGT